MSEFSDAIDVSFYQSNIIWGAVPYPIAIIKMSGGDQGLYTDSKANANYYGAKNAGKAIGMYHFAGGKDAVNEADFFVAAISPLEKYDVPILDWEIPHADPVGWCWTFVNRVHDRTGVWPIIYMNLATLNAHNWNAVLEKCGLWLAAWNNNPQGDLPTHGHQYIMHQYTSDGAVNGIAGRVDKDMFYGSVDQFRKYGWQGTPAPAPIPPPPPLPEPTPTTTTSTTTTTTTTTTLPPPPDYDKENNGLLKQILAILQLVKDKLWSVFK